MRKFSDKGRLEIELKSPDITIVDNVTQLITQYSPPDFEITSFHMPHLAVMRKNIPNANIGLIFNTCLLGDWATEKYKSKLMINYMELSKANFIHLPIAFLNKYYVDLFHSKGYKVHGDLGSNMDQYGKAVELEIDQCTLNDVTVIKSLKSA